MRLPWWMWALIAAFVLNVVLDWDLNIVPLLIIGAVMASVAGPRKGGRRPVPPGSTTGPVPPATGPAPGTGQVPPRPGPVLTGELPPEPAGPMTPIDVPGYPGESVPGGWSGSSAHPSTTPSTDPVVSLAQLHLGRCARELNDAAAAGDRAEVDRTLQEVVDLATRMQQLLEGDGAPGSGRRELRAGMRRLQREATAARGEDPPGPRVAHVVRAAGQMGQTGRYE